MKTKSLCLALILCALPALARQQPTKEPPTEWIDPDTGHRVVRLSREAGSQSLYFHQNAYTTEGDKLIITTPTSVSTIDLKTRVIDKIVDGRVNVIVVGRQSRQVYYTKDNTLFATHLDTKAT